MKHDITLSKDFFFGGNCTFTIKSEKSGEHRTFKIKQAKPNPQFATQNYFVSLLSGPNNESDFTYLGLVDKATGVFRLTKASRMNDTSPAVVILRWFLGHLFTDGLLPNAVVHHEGKCGCCGRTLTVPESITRGIGPECAKRF